MKRTAIRILVAILMLSLLLVSAIPAYALGVIKQTVPLNTIITVFTFPGSVVSLGIVKLTGTMSTVFQLRDDGTALFFLDINQDEMVGLTGALEGVVYRPLKIGSGGSPAGSGDGVEPQGLRVNSAKIINFGDGNTAVVQFKTTHIAGQGRGIDLEGTVTVTIDTTGQIVAGPFFELFPFGSTGEVPVP